MSSFQPAVGQQVFVDKGELRELVNALTKDEYTVIGPTVVQDVITLAPIASADDLAIGVKDSQDAGHYRLGCGDKDLYFQYVLGPISPKRYLFPPTHPLFRMRKENGNFVFQSGPPMPPKLAMIGLRPCELAAMQIQDRVYTSENRCESDIYYMLARKQMVVIAVNCTRPGGTCFCAYMGTGPQAKEGFDLALTELRGGFLVKIGSARGAQLAAKLNLREPTAAEMELAELRLEQAREHMGRQMNPEGLPKLLDAGVEHPQWDDVAKRCMACGNCTMVCPTCFCSSVNDANDLSDGAFTRTRVWDCCYTHQYTYTTSGPVRTTIRARYRHWLRHKLGTWWEQFGTSGCVGCGRCITWCPVGIDLTKEVAAIRSTAPPVATLSEKIAPYADLESEVES